MLRSRIEAVRRRFCRAAGAVALATWLVSPGHAAGSAPAELPGPPAVESAEGLWPSAKLMRLMLDRWADDLSADFDFSEQQHEQVRAELVDQWGTFLEENRGELQPLFNEFIEMRMEPGPPSKERVQEWAKRAAPVFDKVQTRMDGTNATFRKVLTPMQRLKYEAEALQLSAGMGYVGSRLKDWQQGEFREEEFWDPPRRVRQERRRKRESKDHAAGEPDGTGVASDKSSDPPDQIAAELDRWDAYVRDFAVQFELDAGQRSAAMSCLAELKNRAVTHRDAHRVEIASLERRIRDNAGTDAELEQIRQQLVVLYGPLDALFVELQKRLEPIPTQGQRERAGPARSPASP